MEVDDIFITRPDKIVININYEKNLLEYEEHFNLPPKALEHVTGITSSIIRRMYPDILVGMLDDGIRIRLNGTVDEIASSMVSEFFAHLSPKNRKKVLSKLNVLPDDFVMRSTDDSSLVEYLKKYVEQTNEIIKELEEHFNES